MTYRTVAGDTWDLIAYQQLGKETYAGRLIDANPRHINTLVFPSGVELDIPEIDETVEINDNLPPWKLGEG